MSEPIHGVECYEAWREYRDCPHELPAIIDQKERE